ncbi:MAG: hypothetical protein IJR70_05460 [Eubacterium sp.]|nr:hypothetical protein [Eubacterium sp.]
MQEFIDYINTALPEESGNKILFKFKRKILDEMNERAIEVAGRGGIHDQKVINDLIISEHENLKEEYKEYLDKHNSSAKLKKSIITNVLGSIAYILLIVTIFLGVSFATGLWRYTWIIIVDGILFWVDYLLSLGIRKFVSMKRFFHVFARIFLFGAVVVFTVAVFLLVLTLTDLPNSWLIVIAGLILAFLCDGIFASATHAKLAILHWLLYIPVISAFAFIIIGVLGILSWSIAWIIIPLSLILDLIIIIAALSKNKKDKMEVEDIWKEN